ncbi:hypothetical protein RclHR1_03340005 [Rhizophagus clarus]|uniref:Uncharacterized protein n=1 Tax=Rhizophagus clarus TaxID=94130 RepID=A0A2Z6RKZ5_9GLOM|nr:hypothetical protein RclHR1_03340005 [Rhizophagus clarus]
MSQRYNINQYHSEEILEKRNSRIKVASNRLSKLRKRMSIFSYRDSGVGLSDAEGFLLMKDGDRINYIEETLYSDNNSDKHVKIKSVKRFFGIGKGRRRHSEAYHQDGKTNPFE